MTVLTFFVLKRGQTLSKIRISKLIRICRIQWRCSFFLERKHSFSANLVQNIKIVSVSWGLVLRLIRICRIQWRCLLFCFIPETHFLTKEGKQSTIIHRGLFLGTALKFLNNSKRKQTYITWINFLLSSTKYSRGLE